SLGKFFLRFRLVGRGLFFRFAAGLVCGGFFLRLLSGLGDLDLRSDGCRAFTEPDAHGLADRQLTGVLARGDRGAISELDVDGGRLLILLRRRRQQSEALAIGRQGLNSPDKIRVADRGLLVARFFVGGRRVVGLLFSRLTVSGFLVARWRAGGLLDD